MVAVWSLHARSLRAAIGIRNRQKRYPRASSKVSSGRFGRVRYDENACHQAISVDDARIPPPVLDHRVRHRRHHRREPPALAKSLPLKTPSLASTTPHSDAAS
jgi:hypothetical protein